MHTPDAWPPMVIQSQTLIIRPATPSCGQVRVALVDEAGTIHIIILLTVGLFKSLDSIVALHRQPHVVLRLTALSQGCQLCQIADIVGLIATGKFKDLL